MRLLITLSTPVPPEREKQVMEGNFEKIERGIRAALSLTDEDKLTFNIEE